MTMTPGAINLELVGIVEEKYHQLLNFVHSIAGSQACGDANALQRHDSEGRSRYTRAQPSHDLEVERGLQ